LLFLSIILGSTENSPNDQVIAAYYTIYLTKKKTQTCPKFA